jgi:Rap1a immunity proteins
MRAILCATLLALAITMMGSAPVSAAAVMSGKDIYAGCALWERPPASPPPAGDILVQGYCAGAVSAVALTNPSVCPPNGWVTGQAVAAVVRFLDVHPERRHESFFALVLEALMHAWPCKKPQQPRP